MQENLQLARFHRLDRIGENDARLADPAAEVFTALDSLALSRGQLAGKRVAVATGSRGIASLREIVRAACRWLIARGANPFVFPAMGSHGGATDEGQRAILAGYGVVPEFVGAEVRSSVEAVCVAETPEGFPVFMDRNAWSADGVLVINRVKTHTRFTGKIESGLLKMIGIGMGKHRGATECHRLVLQHGFEPVIRSIAGAVLSSGRILAGLAIVENGRHEAAAIRASAPEGVAALDEQMLVLAKSLAPRIPFSRLHLLVVDEIGKDVSGAGMDPKVIGRGLESVLPELPQIDLIYARDLTDETAGNGLGVGLADFIHERLYRRMDAEKMYINARTSLNPWVARLPMWFRSDREALEFALQVSASPGPAEQRLASIRNTLSLDRILISEGLAGEAAELPGWRLSQDACELEFDNEGNLPFRS